jgi:hypothetical protein
MWWTLVNASLEPAKCEFEFKYNLKCENVGVDFIKLTSELEKCGLDGVDLIHIATSEIKSNQKVTGGLYSMQGQILLNIDGMNLNNTYASSELAKC